MDLLHRADDPLPATDLLALERDGLLDRLTEQVWVPAGTVSDPLLRASALPADLRHGLAVSHATAAWVWWGSARGRAPEPYEYTTLVRRRIRSGSLPAAVYERSVPRTERVRFGERWVTSPERTVFDLLVRCSSAQQPVAAAALSCARVPAADRLLFLRWLTGTHRRPYAAVVRELALAALSGSPQPLTR